MELEQIKQSIHEIRGKKVMLDYELAKLYEVETKYLKRSVRNNLNRFPSDFMFKLSTEEWAVLRCKFSTSSWGGQRYPPYAFTEHVIMCSKKAVTLVRKTTMECFRLLTAPRSSTEGKLYYI